MPSGGLWCGRLSQVGQTDWFTFPVRGNRIFTVVTQALDETGAPTKSKAMPSIGVWDAFDPSGATAVGAAPGLNGFATGETWLRVATNGDDMVRIGIADLRGDGRPDYAYNGWVLYADTVSPTHLPASGGPIVIHGMGFRLADTVLVGGQAATGHQHLAQRDHRHRPARGHRRSLARSTSRSTTCPPFTRPPSSPAASVTTPAPATRSPSTPRPSNTVPIGVPLPFTVTALDSNLAPAGGVTVIYTVTSGTATLACGLPVCSVTATGDGRATMNVTAVDGTWSIVTASLTNGSSLQAQFAGGTPPVLSALTPQLSLAAGATFTWTVQALVLNNGVPLSGQSCRLAELQLPASQCQGPASALTNSAGIATQTLTVGPLAEGQTATINACLNGTSQCVAFTAFGARPEYAATRSRLRHEPEPRRLGHAEPDRPAPARHGRQPHGRRHGRALPGALRLDAALLAAHRLSTGALLATASRHGHLRRRRHGHVFPRIAARRGHQSPGPRRLGQHLHRQYFDRAASVRMSGALFFFEKHQGAVRQMQGFFIGRPPQLEPRSTSRVLGPAPYNRERNPIHEEKHAAFRRSHPPDELH